MKFNFQTSAAAKEKVMLSRLLGELKDFYANPQNQKAYQKFKEARINAANHSNYRSDAEKP